MMIRAEARLSHGEPVVLLSWGIEAGLLTAAEARDWALRLLALADTVRAAADPSLPHHGEPPLPEEEPPPLRFRRVREAPPPDERRGRPAWCCRHGHPYSEENTFWFKRAGGWYRQCRECRRRASRRAGEKERRAMEAIRTALWCTVLAALACGAMVGEGQGP